MADSSFGIQPDAIPSIRIFGATTHNLRHVDVSIPTGKLTVITGVSGSGKSSLAFNTIFAEGRHRYLSSRSNESRELLQSVDRPAVDLIDGLPPVLCVEQRMPGARKRSTVATLSDVYDYLRLLYARVGQFHCPTCRSVVTRQPRGSIVKQALQSRDRQKIIVLAPLVRKQAGAHADVFERIVKEGFVRARVDGELIDATAPPELSRSKPHDIEIVVDRLVMKAGINDRLEESIDVALQLGRGQCILSHETDTGWQDRLYSDRLACTECGISFSAIEPRNFSFNSSAGACPVCEGLGVIVDATEAEIPCIACAGTRLSLLSRSVLIDGTSITAFCAMSPARALERIIRWDSQLSRNPGQTTAFPSVIETESYIPASAAESSLQVKNARSPVSGNSSGADGIDPGNQAATRHILPEIASRLQFLSDIGLDYLTLDRGAGTLSAGEFQRTRLAACLGNRLTGVCYILDEPTAGLHASDTARLLKTLISLRDEGNTVILVEHDLDVIRAADYVIDLGPGAGSLGGQVLATGTPCELAANPASMTGRFLDENRKLASAIGKPLSPSVNSPVNSLSNSIRLTGATLHNLKNVTVEIPLRKIVCVTGVSGSGKTSLVIQTLVPAIRRALGEKLPLSGPFLSLTGTENLTRVVRIDQSPLGRSARMTPATYSGLWDDVRKVYARTKESRLRGYTARQFSVNVAEARCHRCAGRGFLFVDEHRFADWQIRCPECDGHRFSQATLSVRYRGQSVADVLEMSMSESASFFENFPRLARTLDVYCELGLGYLKLGQSAATLSGGEAQRVKLGVELAKSVAGEGSTLFVLDEPTAGLHVADVGQLVRVLRRLVTEGHSVLVIEHNTELISAADWRIEIGPGAGGEGGEVVAARDQPGS